MAFTGNFQILSEDTNRAIVKLTGSAAESAQVVLNPWQLSGATGCGATGPLVSGATGFWDIKIEGISWCIDNANSMQLFWAEGATGTQILGMETMGEINFTRDFNTRLSNNGDATKTNGAILLTKTGALPYYIILHLRKGAAGFSQYHSKETPTSVDFK